MQSDSIYTKIALGTVQFGCDYGISNKMGQTHPEEVGRILEVAKSMGLDTVDTARCYGNSESILGTYDLSPFKVVSKFVECDDETALKDIFYTSLNCLNIQHMYGFMAHSARILLDEPDLWHVLQELKTAGEVTKIGYSLYLPSELEALLAKGMYPDLLQVPYNIADRRFESYFPELRRHRVEIHVRSAFLQGALLMPSEDLGDFFQPLKTLLRQLDSIVPKEDRAVYLLRFCLENPFIDRVVIGVNTAVQLKNNCDSVRRHFCFSSLDTGDLPERIILPYMWPSR